MPAQRHPYQWFDRRDPRDQPPTKLPYPQFIDHQRRRGGGVTSILGPGRPGPDTSHIPLSELLAQALGAPAEELHEPIEHEPEPEASPEELAALQDWEERLFKEDRRSAQAEKLDFRPNGGPVDVLGAYRKQIAHEEKRLAKLKKVFGEENYNELVSTKETHTAIIRWLKLSDDPDSGARLLGQQISEELGRPDLRWKIYQAVRKIK
jgi:hypothetical protein